MSTWKTRKGWYLESLVHYHRQAAQHSTEAQTDPKGPEWPREDGIPPPNVVYCLQRTPCLTDKHSLPGILITLVCIWSPQPSNNSLPSQSPRALLPSYIKMSPHFAQFYTLFYILPIGPHSPHRRARSSS